MDARIVAVATEDGGRGPVLVAAGGRHRSRWAALCPASQLLERANPHVLQRIGSEAASIRRDWMRRAEEIDGYLLEAFDLFSAQVQA